MHINRMLKKFSMQFLLSIIYINKHSSCIKENTIKSFKFILNVIIRLN